MAIVVTSAASKTNTPSVLRTIIEVVAASPDITPRSNKTLQDLAKHGHIAVAFDGKKTVGWLIAEPLGVAAEELGMAYVLPDYRRKDILKRLIEVLEDRRKTQVFATYTPEIVTYMETAHGFEKSTLSAVTLATNGRFLTKRLSPKVITSIGGRLTKKPAHYALRKAVK